MADDSIIKTGGSIEPVNLREALEERYLAYALSTIMHRALPDVRDGLKPVHRRLVYAMADLKLNPEGGFKKCAKIVGEVMVINQASVPDGTIQNLNCFSVHSHSSRYPEWEINRPALTGKAGPEFYQLSFGGHHVPTARP